MLWYKAWLETRWRFVIGIALLLLSACGAVLGYPQFQKLMPLMPVGDPGSELGRRIQEMTELARSYDGYIWSSWFRQNLPQTWTMFAVIIGAGGLLSQASSGGGALFTLSLPVTRARLLGVRAATGLAELALLSLVPSLLIPLLSPAIGQTYSIGDALVYGLCLFIAGAVFFSLTFLLSTMFTDVWRPPLLALGVALAFGVLEQLVRDIAPYGLFRVMSAEAYFREGQLPWPGLLATAALSGVMLFAATKNIARQDF